MDKLKEVLKKNPAYAILGKTKLKQITAKFDIPKKVIDEYFSGKELHQIYTKVKKKDGYKINAPPYSYQIDIILIPSYKSQNKGIDKLLLIIEILSRKLYAYPIKTGTMADVLKAYSKFYEDVKHNIISVSGDDFFNNKAFLKFNEEHHINTHTDIAKSEHLTKQGNKLGIIDRSVRTLKSYIQKYMLENDTVKWIKFLPTIIDLYNDSPHKALQNRTPNEAYNDEDYLYEKYAKQQLYNYNLSQNIDLKPGDIVRALVGKNAFEKEKAKYSTELYTIQAKDRNRFILVDENDEPIKRRYRPSEIMKISNVSERLKGSKKTTAEKKHKKTLKLKKALKEIS
jgi:hypothetical protein